MDKTAVNNMSAAEQDVFFTMLVSAATNTDPFETEDYLAKKGIIKNRNNIWD